MIKFILSIFTFFVAFNSFSQTYGNEWIEYNQTYYRFEVAQTGIYKIDYNTLVNAGVPVTSFSTKNMQLFGQQKEQPIYVVDGNDQSFDQGDYFLFYAKKNDGWLDSTLYADPTTIGNPSYSLYNDTINYFFTWNNQINNLRFTFESDNNFAAYTPAPYWLAKVEQSYNTFYIESKDANTPASSSFFLPGEGWSGGHVNGIAGYTLPINMQTLTPYTNAGAPAAKFNGISVSNSNAFNSTTPGGPNHDFSWTVGQNDYLLHTEQFTGYQQKNINAVFPVSLLGNGNTVLKWKINASTNYPTDYQALSYWSLIYAKQTTLNNTNKGRYWIKNNTAALKLRLDITNTTLVNPVMMVFGGIPKLAALSNNGSGVWQTIVSNAPIGIDQEVVIQDESTIGSITQLTLVTSTGKFTDFSQFENDENVILMVYHPNLQNSSNEYAAYRSSVEGGSYNVVMANVNELFMQYGGGIEKHVLGVRRFALDFYDHAMVKPKSLFIVGKGIREANESFNGLVAGTRKNINSYNNSLIPSFGYPSSDALITANLAAGEWEPQIPTGRIAVQTEAQLAEYLQKVKEYDANQDPQSAYNSANKEWQKQVLHFSGGTTIGDQMEFQSYLNSMKDTIEGANFGGNVTTYMKTSSDPLDPTAVADVSARIESGVSLMNFFGHASVDGFEINVDDPTNWNNQGKYPIVIGNACYTGDIFQNYQSTSENFVLLPEEGAIAFISSVRLGFGFSLNRFSSQLYRQFSTQNYGGYLGEQMKNTIAKVRQTFGSDVYTETTCTQMTLHGDPMLRINWHSKPEIDINDQSLYFTPNDINLTDDSIGVHIILTNLGKAISDTFALQVTRTFPSNVDSVYNFLLPNLLYKDTFSFKVPLQPNVGIGINKFTVEVDIPSIYAEFEDYTNNRIENKPLIIDIDGIVPVVPYEFAVVPYDSVTLKGSTVNPIAEFNTYRFEIDTTDLFNSPFKKYAMVSGLGGVKEVNPSQWLNANSNQSSPLVCEDSTVYFWRVAVDSSVLFWRESSFQYINGKRGWGQDHFFQFKKNSFFNVVYDRVSRTRQFDTIPRLLSVDVYNNASGPTQQYGTLFEIDNQLLDYAMCTPLPAIHVAVFDPVTLEAWATRNCPTTTPSCVCTQVNNDHQFGNENNGCSVSCRKRPEKYFIFRQYNPVHMESLRSMILDSVPDGHYILIYTAVRAQYEYWDDITPSMTQTFQDLGAVNIGQGDNKAFIFFYRKGDLSSVQEVVATLPDAVQEKINLTVTLDGFDYKGQENSTIIGPAAKWETLYWKQDPKENPTQDVTMLKIEAMDLQGSVLLTIDTAFTHKDSIIQLNNIIDASLYPYLKLSAAYKDSVTLTPAQVDRWHVLYQPLPEAAIDGSTQYTWIPDVDTLLEGQEVKFAVDVRNISEYPMDSLLISYWIEDVNRVKHFIPYARQDSLRTSDVIRDTITFSTVGYGGINSLWMEVNPYINGTLVTDQLEQFHFNNLLQVPFYVDGDDVNPILDVTFDGVHILNGDIVSPESELLISLKDDNPYLVMNDISDTTLFGIYLTDPNGLQKRIPFVDGNGNTVMQWIPAEAQHKRFKIIYPALFELDGKYTLLVQGSDRSGNLSGDLEYRITFEVIHESSITYMMNYPNPFSTSTKFVFTLTGSEVPDEMIIQVMTVTGKVVREITEDEFGPMHIGRNISEFSWNGTDEFGDPLANGVYLYRVLTQINGEDIKHRESGADSHFKKEFGKMYIMR